MRMPEENHLCACAIVRRDHSSRSRFPVLGTYVLTSQKKGAALHKDKKWQNYFGMMMMLSCMKDFK